MTQHLTREMTKDGRSIVVFGRTKMTCSPHGPFTIVTVEGYLDFLVAQTFREQLARQADHSGRGLIVEMTVDFVDPAALGVLAGASKAQRESARVMYVVASNGGPTGEALRSTGLAFGGVHETVADALRAAGETADQGPAVESPLVGRACEEACD